MDDLTKSMIAEAFALDNECKREDERRAWQRRQQQQEQTTSTVTDVQALRDEVRHLVGVIADELGAATGKLARQVAELEARLKSAELFRDGRTIVGPPGPRGEKGEPGRDGKDAVIIDKRGEVVELKGRGRDVA